MSVLQVFVDRVEVDSLSYLKVQLWKQGYIKQETASAARGIGQLGQNFHITPIGQGTLRNVKSNRDSMHFQGKNKR